MSGLASAESFEVWVPGKWVLAGEHAVLRGVPAVALPHPELGLTLRFRAGGAALEVEPPAAGRTISDLLAIAERAPPSGTLTIESTIPAGAGLGSSAALCVAISRWLGVAPESEVAFATRLEDRFHGQSSGMDVAAISRGQPIRFTRGGQIEPIACARLPRFSFHDSGLRSETREAIRKVESLRAQDPARARQVDGLMHQASTLAEQGLKLYSAGDAEGGLQLIARAMDASYDCFERWRLNPEPARQLRRELIAQGARSVKLTGAGDGGFVVAVWGAAASS